MNKEIYFKIGVSKKIGTGHLFRSLNIATNLAKKKINLYLLINKTSIKNKFIRKNLKSKFFKKTFIFKNDISEINFLKYNNINNLLVDDPEFNYKKQLEYRKYIKNKLIIYEDIPKKNYADVIINHNFINNYKKKYNKLSKKNAKLLTGIGFFPKEKNKLINRKKTTIKKILIFFGGLSNKKLLNYVLTQLSQKFNERVEINCFLGLFNNQSYDFKKKYKKIIFHKTKLQKIYLNYLKNSDLFIGSGGTSLFESLIYGVPSIVFCTAKNQLNNCKNFSKQKSVFFVKNKTLFNSKFKELYFNEKKYQKLKIRSINVSKNIGSKNLINNLYKLIIK